MSDDRVEMPDLELEVAEGSRLSVLRAIAALAAHELAGNRCAKCQMSYMKTGEISSLMLRLQKVYEDIEALEDEEAARNARDEASDNGDKPQRRSLSEIQRDGPAYLRVVGESGSEDSDLPQHGTKNAPRRSPGSYKPRR